MNVESPRATGLSIARLVAIVVVVSLASSSVARAQVTLLVAAETATASAVEAAIAEGIRDGLGASVRRVEPSLEDLALAAGCVEETRAPSCIALIARASGARLVAVEHVSREAGGYRVHIDLRRGSDGGAIRSVRLACASSVDCRERLVAVLENGVVRPDTNVAHEIALTAVRRPEPSPEPVIATVAEVAAAEPTPAPEPAHRRARPPVGHPIPVTPNVLFGTAALFSLGAMISGGIAVGLQQARDTVAAGTASVPAQADLVGSLESSRDWALGFGTGFALVGACLAAAGALAMSLLPREGSVEARLDLSVSGTGGAAMLRFDGTF